MHIPATPQPLLPPIDFDVANNYTSMRSTIDRLQRWLEPGRMPSSAAYFVILTVEEMVCRCIRFGYQDEKEHRIAVSVTHSAADVTVRIVDDAVPYNPNVERAPFEGPPLDRRRTEGLGMVIVRAISSEILYSRDGESNVSTFRKRIRNLGFPES